MSLRATSPANLFLAERPQNTVGLSIPGIPSGVPGMEGPKEGPITVYAVKKDGTTTRRSRKLGRGLDTAQLADGLREDLHRGGD